VADAKNPSPEAAVPPAAQRTRLRINSGFYEGLEWELDRPSTVIGRGRNADLVLNEATISRAHALFGYISQPSALQVLVYVAVLAAICWLGFRRPAAPAHAAE